MSLQSILTGVEATTFRNPMAPPINSLVPVTLRTTSEFRDDVTALETTRIFSARTGETVPLKQIANIKLDWAPGYIYTRDRVFTMNVSATLADDATSAEIDAVMVPWLNEKIAEWGPEFKWELGGENESSNDNSQALGSKLPIAGLIIVLLLVAQFNSIKKPIVILSSIPLGIIGVSVGLLISGEKFGFMPLVALVSLAGVVINNAIVLLDSIDIQLSDFGRTPQAAVIEACQRRMRPILLTTITTLCGLLPLWFFGGTLFAPLAVALIFGLIFGTTLTLGVVPLFYAVLFKVSFKEYEYVPATETDNR
jgi:multidrug efflux pump subunit AcrB